MAVSITISLLDLPDELLLLTCEFLEPSSAQQLTKTCRALYSKKEDIIDKSLPYSIRHLVVTDVAQLRNLDRIKIYIRTLDLSAIPTHSDYSFLNGCRRLQKVIIIMGTVNKKELFEQLTNTKALVSFKKH